MITFVTVRFRNCEPRAAYHTVESMKIVIPYLRFSPRKDAELSESLETQLAYIVEHCKANGDEICCNDGVKRSLDDIRVEHVFSDAGMSGDDEDRPGLWHAIESLKKGYVLLVYKYDRLCRSIYLDQHIRRLLESRKATLDVVVGNRESDDPNDELVRNILMAVAVHEKKIISARTKAAMLMLQKSGRAMGSRPPYGWKRGPDKVVTDRNGQSLKRRYWVPDEAELETIDQIMLRHSEGQPYHLIACGLNAAGMPCRKSRWNYKAVRSVVLRRLDA